MLLAPFHGEPARPLPARDQLRLLEAYRATGDRALEAALVATNLRLVVKLARELDRTHGRALEDLVPEGSIGLLVAIRRFDPTKGAALGTYAAFWIRAFIMKHLMEAVRVVRSVRSRADRAAFYRGTVGGAEVSLETPADPDARTLGDVIADPAPSAEQRLEAAELTHDVRRAAAALADRLDARDAAILRERLIADPPTPRRRLAQRSAVTSSRIGQIEARLRGELRAALGAA
jgi:RNA polymerase sigma-32 factor